MTHNAVNRSTLGHDHFAMTDAALISVKHLHKRFGRKPVLRGIDLDVAQGEVVALVGANWRGQTTLMRMTCGLAKPDRGEISLGERVPATPAAAAATSAWSPMRPCSMTACPPKRTCASSPRSTI